MQIFLSSKSTDSKPVPRREATPENTPGGQPRAARLVARSASNPTHRPQTNGKAERFIQTLTREWAYARSYVSSDHRASFLPLYLHDYNFHRPHSALHYKPPASRLPKSADNLSRYNS